VINWKQNIQVRDLDDAQKLEITCKACGHVHYLAREIIMKGGEDREFLYLDQIEDESICKARGCNGKVRLAIVKRRDTSAFIGGLA
jgi:hypothetical protein